MIQLQFLWKLYIQEHCKQPNVHTSVEYWKVDNIKDPARPQSNTVANLLADFWTLVHTQKCQSALKLAWKD